MGINGVSTSTTPPRPGDVVSSASRQQVEEHFRVHDTPTRNDAGNKTVELPDPVTQTVADIFNWLFGRS